MSINKLGVSTANPELKGEQLVEASSGKGMNKKASGLSMNANSQNRLDTSDDNASNNALIPMGIQEYPITPTERASRKAKASAREQIEPLEENDAMGTMMVGSDEKSTTRKHQVYSHLDDMPA